MQRGETGPSLLISEESGIIFFLQKKKKTFYALMKCRNDRVDVFPSSSKSSVRNFEKNEHRETASKSQTIFWVLLLFFFFPSR